jgi:hypothetical protein
VIAEFVVERERDDEGKIHSLRKRKVRVESGEKYLWKGSVNKQGQEDEIRKARGKRRQK